jgi:hypothetical protein
VAKETPRWDVSLHANALMSTNRSSFLWLAGL